MKASKLIVRREQDVHMIYLIKCGKYVKIGKTNNNKSFKSRLSNLNIGLPYKLMPICVISSLGCGLTEGQVRALFTEHRHKGEWFKVEKEILDWFFEQWKEHLRQRRPCSSVFNMDNKVELIDILETDKHKGFTKRIKKLDGLDEKYEKWVELIIPKQIGRPPKQ